MKVFAFVLFLDRTIYTLMSKVLENWWVLKAQIISQHYGFSSTGGEVGVTCEGEGTAS